jgi:hypothetical protein
MRLRAIIVPALFCCALLLCASAAQAQPEGQPCSAEPTDQLLSYGAHVFPCDIGLLGDSDLFRFQGAAGEVVWIRVVDQAGGSSIPSCYLELFRPLGTLVTAVSHITSCEIRTTLDGSGLFTARVQEAGNDSLMTYSIQIERLTPPSVAAASINPGDTINSATIDPRGDVDQFIFNGVSGDTISLRATDQAGGSSIPSCYLDLYRPDGTLVAAVSNITLCTIDTTLNQTGVFTVRVLEAGDDSPMTYNLEYQCLLGSCPSFHKLTVARSGAGAVTSTPPGINCGLDCTERYFAGTLVALAAAPDPGGAFIGWSGDQDCNDGIVTMTTARSCIATFQTIVPPLADVAIDFGPGIGLWGYYDGGAAPWQPLHNLSPTSLVTGDLDGNGRTDLVLTFAGLGLWAFMNNITWTQFHSLDAGPIATGDIDGNGRDDLVATFPGYGVWIRFDSGAWQQLHGLAPAAMAVGDMDGAAGGKADVVLSFPGFGTWAYVNNASWTHLHPLAAVELRMGDLDGTGVSDLIVQFPGFGEWIYYNNASWTQLHALAAAGFATGNIDADAGGRTDVIVNFAGLGVWAFLNNSSWVQLHGLNAPVLATGDVDGNGQADVILSFPGFGVWSYKNLAAWTQIHGAAAEALVTGRLNTN